MGRKLVGWFRVYSDILEDPRLMDQKREWVPGAFLRLLAMANRSEARDGVLWLPHSAFCVAMGRQRMDYALLRLRYLVASRLIAAALHEHSVLILIPKYLERQGNAVQQSTHKDKDKDKDKDLKAPPIIPPRKKERLKRQKTSPPKEGLSESQFSRLEAWASKSEPWAVDRLPEFEAACIEYHTRENNLSADWNLNIHQWIRNHKQWHGTGNGGTHGPKPGTLDAALADQLERIDRAERENAARDEATSQLSLTSGRES